jgi:hypothetical protein
VLERHHVTTAGAVLLLAATACTARPAPILVADVKIRVDGSNLFFNYPTRTSIQDCDGLRAEMRFVWSLAVKKRLEGTAVQHVFLMPEETSGRSLGVAFTKGGSGQWSTTPPCAISIPADGAAGPG